ncbi:hypothetical protein [Sphingomonas sp. G-3-2-10]|uniref:hypothetical protein n=1 Tax=Sphingomonas sp. G-3-2-10 TaxID=2728838 RepID=UPI00146CD9A6|nr:hypothetical protein [Sphingomonas sp. G-3-2-10]NML04781.1 hypothetical protein [Sphingomonas sp. G-3-2-10]
MALIRIMLANAAGTAAAPATAPESALPVWISVAGVTGLFSAMAAFFLSIAAVVLALRLKAFLTHGPDPKELAFVKSLRGEVREHSRRIDERLAARMATVPASLESLRALLRGLRGEISEPMAYLARMAAVPVTSFGEPEISSAFGAWAGVVRALGEAIDHLYADTSYAGSDIDVRRETYLLRQYGVEAEHILALRAKVKESAGKLDKLAGAYIVKHTPKDGSKAESDHKPAADHA